MAEIQAEPSSLPAVRGTVSRVVWPHMKAGDVGTPFVLLTGDSASIQVIGSLGNIGTLLLVEGANQDGPDYSVLTDPRGNDLSLRSASLERIEMPVGQIRPRVTGGDKDTDITVILLVRSHS